MQVLWDRQIERDCLFARSEKKEATAKGIRRRNATLHLTDDRPSRGLIAAATRGNQQISRFETASSLGPHLPYKVATAATVACTAVEYP